jgi:hypothetical protein
MLKNASALVKNRMIKNIYRRISEEDLSDEVFDYNTIRKEVEYKDYRKIEIEYIDRRFPAKTGLIEVYHKE